MSRRSWDSGRQAAIWFATTVVLVIGAGASAFVIVAGSEQPEVPLMIWAAAFGGLILFLISLTIRWDQSSARLQIWLHTKTRQDPTDTYRAARRRIETNEEYGQNGPPTVESVKDAVNHAGAWVPRSSTSTTRRPKRS